MYIKLTSYIDFRKGGLYFIILNTVSASLNSLLVELYTISHLKRCFSVVVYALFIVVSFRVWVQRLGWRAVCDCGII